MADTTSRIRPTWRRIVAALLALPFAVAVVAALRGLVDAGRRRPVVDDADVPIPDPSAGLAVGIGVDTLITLPMGLLSSMGKPDEYRRSSEEVSAAASEYAAWGWLDEPGGRHPAPPPLHEVRVEPGGHDLERLRFTSGWQPRDGEPGGERWRGLEANQQVPVALLRHDGGPRPWLIAVHGQGMGRPSDVRMLRMREMHHRLGVNVAMPVLPLHGERAAGYSADEQFVSNVFLLNNVFGLTQAVWDIRRLMTWLRDAEEAPAIGALGVSLGSYVCNLLSTVTADLACLVAVVPTSDLAASLRDAAPSVPARRRLHRELHDERSDAVHHVVSPLARPCLVPHERRFIVAGMVDRIAPPDGAAALWRHWDKPSIEWRARGHVTTFRSKPYDDHIAAVLAASGMAFDDSTPVT